MPKAKYKINPEYANSRPVNYNRWSEYSEISDLLTDIMVGFDTGRKRSGYLYNMKVLVLDLFESYCSDPERYIGVHLDNNHFKFKLKSGANESRYFKNPHITADYFKGCVSHLAVNGFIELVEGGHFRDESGKEYGFLSRIRPTAKFSELCARYKLTLDMVGKFADEELIKLKSTKVKNEHGVKVSTEVEYKDTPETNRMKSVIRKYNLLMDNTYLDVDVECLSVTDRNELVSKLESYKDEALPQIVLEMNRRNVYRVFNNSDFTFRQGGRFYGAFWMECPGILRKYITINGSPTVELDYSGIHIQLAYALEGINYAELKEDPYSLIENDPNRDLNKLILLTALNAADDHLTASSVFNELREKRELSKYRITSHEPIQMILDLLKQKHLPIKSYIAEDKGIYLQYYDSLVVEKLINYFTNKMIPILSVHDSIICEEEHTASVKNKMYEFYINIINSRLKSLITNSTKKLHVKYQIQTTRISNWQKLIADNNLKFKIPRYLPKTFYSKSIITTRSSLNYFLRNDVLINIKETTKSNKCLNNCNTFKRASIYATNKFHHKNTIKIKLQLQDNRYFLDVIN